MPAVATLIVSTITGKETDPVARLASHQPDQADDEQRAEQQVRKRHREGRLAGQIQRQEGDGAVVRERKEQRHRDEGGEPRSPEQRDVGPKRRRLSAAIVGLR